MRNFLYLCIWKSTNYKNISHMQINSSKIVEIYFILDEFSKKYLQIVNAHKVDDGKNHRNKPNKMSDAEVMLILIMFHDGGYKCLKHYYINYICKHCHDLFPTTLSYNRFVELQRSVLIELGYFVKTCLMAECTGISFVDSTPLRVCREQRILQHKVFQGFAQRGKCSMGWFFGFKLHIIINDRGELINFMITPGNVDDRDPLKQQHFVEAITGKLFADRGYIGKELFGELFINGIQLVTKLKKGMKNMLMSQSDKILLRKRSLVESVNDELKNMAQIEHSRHRSIANFLTNAFAAIAAYCYFPKKPSLNLQFENDNQLVLF